MLNKFENPEKDLPPEDPRFAIMEAWANLNAVSSEHLPKALQFISDFDWLVLSQKRDVPNFNYAVEMEAKLQQELPELNDALGTLRTALDKVSGWHITWRHYERGEAIGTSITEEMAEEIDERIVIASIMRGPAQYHLNQGWVVGSQVGVDRILGGINAWLEIGNEQNASHGMYFQLGEMLAIELTAPDKKP